MTIHLDMLSVFMKLRASSDENCSLIIIIHLHRDRNHTLHFMKKRLHPHHLKSYMSNNTVLGLCTRTSHNGLPLITRHKITTNKDTIAISRPSITATTCLISITKARHHELM